MMISILDPKLTLGDLVFLTMERKREGIYTLE
jgi:hypothetical protein